VDIEVKWVVLEMEVSCFEERRAGPTPMTVRMIATVTTIIMAQATFLRGVIQDCRCKMRFFINTFVLTWAKHALTPNQGVDAD
jgi:hypothetical protein